jgi:hypothetical protein
MPFPYMLLLLISPYLLTFINALLFRKRTASSRLLAIVYTNLTTFSNS